MYLSDENRIHASEILTDRELLFDKISHKRMIQIINKPSVRVVSLKRDSNYHGEFLWISLVHNNYYFTAYSMGFHEGKDRYITDEWSLVYFEKYSQDIREKRNHVFRMDRQLVLDTIQKEQDECIRYQEKHTTSEEGKLYELIAELSDEDGAYSMLEDFGYLMED